MEHTNPHFDRKQRHVYPKINRYKHGYKYMRLSNMLDKLMDLGAACGGLSANELSVSSKGRWIKIWPIENGHLIGYWQKKDMETWDGMDWTLKPDTCKLFIPRH